MQNAHKKWKSGGKHPIYKLLKVLKYQHKECVNAYVVMLDNISNDFRFADRDESS